MILYSLKGELTSDLHTLVGSICATYRALFRLNVDKYRLYTQGKEIPLDLWAALRTGVPEIQARALAYCIKESVSVIIQVGPVGDGLKAFLLSIPWTKPLCRITLKTLKPASSNWKSLVVVEEFLKTFLDPSYVPNLRHEDRYSGEFGSCILDLKETVVERNEKIEKGFLYSRYNYVDDTVIYFIEIGYLHPVIELLRDQTTPIFREKLAAAAVKFVRKELFPLLEVEVKEVKFDDTYTTAYPDLVRRARDVLDSEYHLFLSPHSRIAYRILTGEMMNTSNSILTDRMGFYGMATFGLSALVRSPREGRDTSRESKFDTLSVHLSSSFIYDGPGLMRLYIKNGITLEVAIVRESFRLGHGTTLHVKKKNRKGRPSFLEEDKVILEEMEAKILKELRE